ncbi:hypothetical protein H0O00_04575 [Candidatus Micrarchaeota archaeon]|nr:hypothetical protein [Candidatus Micrarchaeota archaeon]
MALNAVIAAACAAPRQDMAGSAEREKPGHKTRSPSAEPLAEKLQKQRRSRGFFSNMSNDELVSFAQGFVRKKGITKRTELQNTDSGLYYALWERKQLDRVFAPTKPKNAGTPVRQADEED